MLTLVLAAAATQTPSRVAVLSHADLVAQNTAVVQDAMRRAFVGDEAFRLLIIKDIPGFAVARRAAFNATIRMLRDPPSHSLRPRNSWPGFRHPNDVQEPLQGGFLHNMLEDVGPKKVDPIFGKNPWPDEQYKANIVALNQLVYSTSLLALEGVDRIVEEEAHRKGAALPQVTDFAFEPSLLTV